MTKYKGYIGQFDVDIETGLIRGKVVNTRDIITFHGTTVREAEQAFRDSVDDYLAFCEDLGESPEKPYSGKLLVRVTPKLHQELDVLAKSKGKSVNTLVAGCLARMTRRLPYAGRNSLSRAVSPGPVKDSTGLAAIPKSTKSPKSAKDGKSTKSPKGKKAPAQIV
jgi:predicted HicB family RNase H-like nuclease